MVFLFISLLPYGAAVRPSFGCVLWLWVSMGAMLGTGVVFTLFVLVLFLVSLTVELKGFIWLSGLVPKASLVF